MLKISQQRGRYKSSTLLIIQLPFPEQTLGPSTEVELSRLASAERVLRSQLPHYQKASTGHTWLFLEGHF